MSTRVRLQRAARSRSMWIAGATTLLGAVQTAMAGLETHIPPRYFAIIVAVLGVLHVMASWYNREAIGAPVHDHEHPPTPEGEQGNGNTDKPG